MSSNESGAGWRRRRIPPLVASVLLVVGGSTRRAAPLAPQLRGRVNPRILEGLEQRGWHVHRIGAAAYVHAPDRSEHLIFGVWRHRSTSPAWALRLGRASAGYVRRLERVTREQRWRRQARDLAGRFSVLMPWHRWPTPALYSWDPAGPSVTDQAAALALESRIRAGLAGYPAEASESELRLMAGDR